jgi:hypothetical protein
MKAFQSIPQRYCFFCEANAGLGIDAHKPDAHFAGLPSLSIKKLRPDEAIS